MFSISFYRLLFSLVVLSSPTLASSSSSSTDSFSLGPLVVHFEREAPPAGYELLSTSSLTNTPLTGNVIDGEDGEQVLDLKIGLASDNLEGLREVLKDVSTPGNARYQKYLSEEEVQTYIRPSQKTKDALDAWLSAHNISSKPITPAGEWVQITNLPVKKANTLLKASYQIFVHPATQATALRTLSYSIPEGLKGLVETVYPGASFDFGVEAGSKTSPVRITSTNRRMTKRKKRSPAPSTTALPASCATFVTPSCLQELYNIPTLVPKPENGLNSLMITGYDNQFAQEADLKSFLSAHRPDIPSSTTFTLKTLDNGTNPQNPSQAGREANLDIEIAVGLVGTTVPVTFLSVGETNENKGLGAHQDTANYLLGLGSERPTVVSTSYGFDEPDLDPTAMRKLCDSYLQLGVLGTSIIFSSGDGAVSGNVFSECADNGRFVPAFPSSCPYVTSVGGTTASSTFPNEDPEMALFFSSGGFSNVFSTPWYQTEAVSEYERLLGTNYTDLYNKTGRGFPDVSAIGSNVVIFSRGEETRAGGTSTSAPIFASIIALLNSQLATKGRPPLGFLNPWLYSSRVENVKAFNIVRSGSNPGCNTTGFAAVDGWDAVTGLGTPNFGNLAKAL